MVHASGEGRGWMLLSVILFLRARQDEQVKASGNIGWMALEGTAVVGCAAACRILFAEAGHVIEILPGAGAKGR